MTVHAIITTLSYSSDSKYSFDPKCLHGDLRKSVCHSINKMGVLPENIYVLTDLNPKREIINNMFLNYKSNVMYLLQKKGFQGDTPTDNNAKQWLLKVVTSASEQLEISKEDMFVYLNKSILPKLNSQCVLEYTILFCNFIYINQSGLYEKSLQKFVSYIKSNDKLFFYYSGHGIRKQGKPYLQIPICPEQIDLIEPRKIHRILSLLPEGSEAIIVFDCCHSEYFSTLKIKIPIPVKQFMVSNRENIKAKIIFIGSSLFNETCGFFKNPKNGEYSSVFSQFFFGTSLQGSLNMLNRLNSVVNIYRRSVQKPQQNIALYVSDQSIKTFFPWLLQTGECKVHET